MPDRPDTGRLWHGSGRIAGDWIVPPKEHGHARVCHDDEWVYLTLARPLALSYASTTDCPWLYEVEPIGVVEHDPDSLLPPGESVRCQRARIVRRFKPSRAEVDAARSAVHVGASLLVALARYPEEGNNE